MNFVRFPVAGTNIFPIANSVSGGQLLTEFNLRSRESIATDSRIKYMVGPTYTHSDDEFIVRMQTDNDVQNPQVISNTTLEILPGKAIINGHYFETLVPVLVDLAEANAIIQSEGGVPLRGKLVIGLKAMYSTEETIAGSLLKENGDNLCEGVQIVILPPDEFIMPGDDAHPDSFIDESVVTAHLKLAEFEYSNGAIMPNIILTTGNSKYIPASRIKDTDGLLSDIYVTKTGLDPSKLYAFAGRGTYQDASGKNRDTWVDATDSLMVFDSVPQYQTTLPAIREAAFGVTVDGTTVLSIPHKQNDWNKNQAGQPRYLIPKTIPLPVADFNAGTPGTVNSAYTNQIKLIKQMMCNYYQTVEGEQKFYLDELNDKANLPPIGSAWNVGDYGLVRSDYYAQGEYADNGAAAPSSMYVVLPGRVSEITYAGKVENSSTIPNRYSKRCQLGIEDFGVLSRTDGSVDPNVGPPTDTSKSTAGFATYNSWFGLSDVNNPICGRVATDTVVGTNVNTASDKAGDYFVITWEHAVGEKNQTDYYYYEVTATRTPKEYSDPIILTGNIQYATEDVIGGFKNVPESAQDAGYVYLDSDGHLRLLDYTLLRSGVLAYQLGEDMSYGQGLTNADIQKWLNENVNDRVAFPSATQLAAFADGTVKDPYTITITLTLSEYEESDETNQINIQNIDSRFGTSVCIIILGTAKNTTCVNINNCEKVRIVTPNECSPIINVYRSKVYYDAGLINYIRICDRTAFVTQGVLSSTFTGFQDLSFWYQKIQDSDPNLIVDNMTISEVEAPIIPTMLDYWSQATPNDNHFKYALRSITFSGTGEIIACSLYVSNDSTNNVQAGTSIVVSKFTLPQGAGLQYPDAALVKPLKVDGTFTTAYPDTQAGGYVTTFTQFTAITATYNIYNDINELGGNISVFNNTQIVTQFGGDGLPSSEKIPALDCWASGSYHIFYGGVIGQ